MTLAQRTMTARAMGLEMANVEGIEVSGADEADWEAAVSLFRQARRNEGLGHTLALVVGGDTAQLLASLQHPGDGHAGHAAVPSRKP